MPGTPAISLKRAAKLTVKKHREAERLFLAEGEAVIRESTEPPRRLFDEPGEVRRLSTLTTPTGPIGVFSFLDVSAEELLSTTGRIVLLHGVQDPGNVGTVVRSAHAFGAGVALSRGCADLYNPKTVRATMGSIFRAPVTRELDSLGFLEEAAMAGYRLVAAVPEEASRTRWRNPGSAYAARRASSDLGISSANTGFVFSVNGSIRVIENVSGRGDTCGHTSAPFARPCR